MKKILFSTIIFLTFAITANAQAAKSVYFELGKDLGQSCVTLAMILPGINPNKPIFTVSTSGNSGMYIFYITECYTTDMTRVLI